MEVNPNRTQLNELVQLTNPDDAQNSTKKAADAFAKVLPLFGINPLGAYLATPTGGATVPIENYKGVLADTRPVNIMLDWAYPGEATGVDPESQRMVSYEKSNLGLTLNIIRGLLAKNMPLQAVAVLYDEGADLKNVVANLYFAWPEVAQVVNDAIAQKLREVLAAESAG